MAKQLKAPENVLYKNFMDFLNFCIENEQEIECGYFNNEKWRNFFKKYSATRRTSKSIPSYILWVQQDWVRELIVNSIQWFKKHGSINPYFEAWLTKSTFITYKAFSSLLPYQPQPFIKITKYLIKKSLLTSDEWHSSMNNHWSAIDNIHKNNEFVPLKISLCSVHEYFEDAADFFTNGAQSKKIYEDDYLEITLSRKEEKLIDVESQNLKTSVESLQKENHALKCEADQLRSSFDHLKSEITSQVKNRDALIQELKDQLASEKERHEVEVTSLSLNHAAICKKLEASKQELEEIRSKIKDFEQHFCAEKVKKLIAEVNSHMDNGEIDSAIKTLTSYVFNANLISNFNLVNVFNKIHRIKQLLKSFEEHLLHSNDLSLITSIYNKLKNVSDYPNLIVCVEKKLLRFCYDRKCNLTAFSLCETLVKIRDCKDASVYFIRGKLLSFRRNYYDAREAFFYALKFSKEGDPDLQTMYEHACEALELQISENIWTLFHSDGISLSQKELNFKYKELLRYYHPDKQHGFVKQYRDIAECMSKELTKAYRSLSEQ